MSRSISFSKKVNLDSTKINNLICNFSNYKNFIPGCTNSISLEKTSSWELGQLEFNLLGKTSFIKTKNTYEENHIIMNQVEGPFDDFKGEWIIENLGKEFSNVIFKANFKLPFLIDAVTPNTLIESMSEQIINSFIKQVR